MSNNNMLIHPNYHKPLYNVDPDGRVGVLNTVTSSGLPIYEDASSVNPDVMRAQEIYAHNGGLPSVEEEGLYNVGDDLTMLALPIGPVAGAVGKGIWDLGRYGVNALKGALAPQPRLAYAGVNAGSRARPNVMLNENTNWSKGTVTADGGMPTGVSTSAGTTATRPATGATANTVGKEAEAVAKKGKLASIWDKTPNWAKPMVKGGALGLYLDTRGFTPAFGSGIATGIAAGATPLVRTPINWYFNSLKKHPIQTLVGTGMATDGVVNGFYPLAKEGYKNIKTFGSEDKR